MATQTNENAMFLPATPVTTKSKDGCWKTKLNSAKDGKHTVSAQFIGQVHPGYNCGIVPSIMNPAKPPQQVTANSPQQVTANSPQHVTANGTKLPQVKGNPQIAAQNNDIPMDSQKNNVSHQQFVEFDGKLLVQRGDSYIIKDCFDLPYQKKEQNQFNRESLDKLEQKVYTFPKYFFPGIQSNTNLQNELKKLPTEGFNFGAILQPHGKVPFIGNDGKTFEKEFIDVYLLVLFKNKTQNAGHKLTKTQESATFTITTNNKKRTYTRIVHKGAHGTKFVKFNGTFQRLSTLRRQ